MEYVLFLFIFAGEPDAGAVPAHVVTHVFGTQEACHEAASVLEEFVLEYASKGEKIGKDAFDQVPELQELSSFYLQGHRARTLCLPKG